VTTLNIGIDFDGTILDSTYRHQKVLRDALIEYGFYVSLEYLNDFVEYKRYGYTTKEYLTYKNISTNPELLDNMNKLWITLIEDSKYLQYDKVYDDAFQNLRDLDMISNIYLVTARKNVVGVINQLNTMDLNRFFTDVFVVSPGNHSYSNKASVTRNLSIKYVIGDTETDYSWSNDLEGSCFYALNRGFRNKQWWEQQQGICSFDNLTDIVQDIQMKEH
jgi:phosphoglycolate phosphatase-like HAD superfamily hydrolase